MRLFVAIAIPDDVSARLSAVMGGLDGARWVDPENFHLTLRFVGEVDSGVADDLEGALAGLQSPAFDLQLKGFGHFERSGRPRALWADVEPEPLLALLRGRVEAAVRRAGLAPEGRRFTPHVTLARLDGTGGQAVSTWIADRSPFALAPFPVREVTLFRSFLGREGPRYRAEATVPLQRLPDGDDWPEDWAEDGAEDQDGPADVPGPMAGRDQAD